MSLSKSKIFSKDLTSWNRLHAWYITLEITLDTLSAEGSLSSADGSVNSDKQLSKSVCSLSDRILHNHYPSNQGQKMVCQSVKGTQGVIVDNISIGNYTCPACVLGY